MSTYEYEYVLVASSCSYFDTMNQQRRLFRGRGGPTDRRLPKVNARRRRTARHLPGIIPTQHGHATAGTGQQDVPDALDSEDEWSDVDNNTAESVPNLRLDERDENEALLGSAPHQGNERLTSENSCLPPVPSEHAIACTDTNNAELVRALHAELLNLRRRARRIQESISLSSVAIANPTVYRDNVLYAVKNCVMEWRTIVVHYRLPRRPPSNQPRLSDSSLISDQSADSDDDENDSATTSSFTERSKNEIAATVDQPSELLLPANQLHDASVMIFELIQQAVQVGPLRGSSPGYFKRCGADVANLVLNEFLNPILQSNVICHLYFTDKQVQVVAAWKRNAFKAGAAGKSPSRATAKNEAAALKMKERKQGIRNKKTMKRLDKIKESRPCQGVL
jgi:hypothetical protein